MEGGKHVKLEPVDGDLDDERKSDTSSKIDDGYSSDIEIVDSGILRASYFHQQIQLIQDLTKITKNIPKEWNNFKAFVKRNIKWKPSDKLIFSAYTKLCISEETLSRSGTTEVIDLSNDDDSLVEETCLQELQKYSDNIVTSRKRRSSDFIVDNADISNEKRIIGGTIDIDNPHNNNNVPLPKPIPCRIIKKKRASKQNANVENSHIVTNCGFDNSSLSCIPIPSTSSSSEETNATEGLCTTNIPTANCSSPLSTVFIPKKRTYKRKSKAETEKEAEELREKLLIDKLIELELPGVIRSVLETLPDVQPISPKKNRSSRATAVSNKKR